MNWTAENISDQTGRTFIVTGANAGIGFEASRVLAAKGARVVMACRSESRGQAAVEKIQAQQPDCDVQLAQLDLSSLQSVREFADGYIAKHTQLDVLINNAGVMTPPESKTEDGFELQIGVNFLGHFALTAHLFGLLSATPASRVVTLSSVAHRAGKIDIGSFRGEKPYKAWREYGQSKLACLMFALELQQRLAAAGRPLLSLAAHPGGTKTDLQRHSMLSRAFGMIMMEPAQGALPTLYAATAPEAQGGQYIGPNGWFELGGYPAAAKIARQALDTQVSVDLWKAAESMTGTPFPIA